MSDSFEVKMNTYRYTAQSDSAVLRSGACSLQSAKSHEDIGEQCWKADFHFYSAKKH